MDRLCPTRLSVRGGTNAGCSRSARQHQPPAHRHCNNCLLDNDTHTCAVTLADVGTGCLMEVQALSVEVCSDDDGVMS